MAAATEAWAELMKVSFGMVGTSVRAGEMMIASGSVVGARMTLMGNAVRSPAEGDYEEIGGILNEKVTAFSQVGQALVDHWSAMLTDTTEQAHRFGSLAFGGRPLGPSDLPGLAEDWLAHSARMMARTMETGGLAMAPFHERATVNARRLSLSA
jgi:hypothetical protein